MAVADRIAKLRRMAEHPASNPHEAAIARTEMERLQRAHPQASPAAANGPLTWADVARAGNTAQFEELLRRMEQQDEERFAAAIGPERYAEYRRQMEERRARRAWFDEECRLYPRTDRLRSEAARWTATLRAGDRVRTLHDIGAYEGPPLPSEILIVERRTPSGVVVMTDGSKWNNYGYKRGETGREGFRTFIVAA